MDRGVTTRWRACVAGATAFVATATLLSARCGGTATPADAAIDIQAEAAVMDVPPAPVDPCFVNSYSELACQGHYPKCRENEMFPCRSDCDVVVQAPKDGECPYPNANTSTATFSFACVTNGKTDWDQCPNCAAGEHCVVRSALRDHGDGTATCSTLYVCVSTLCQPTEAGFPFQCSDW